MGCCGDPSDYDQPRQQTYQYQQHSQPQYQRHPQPQYQRHPQPQYAPHTQHQQAPRLQPRPHPHPHPQQADNERRRAQARAREAAHGYGWTGKGNRDSFIEPGLGQALAGLPGSEFLGPYRHPPSPQQQPKQAALPSPPKPAYQANSNMIQRRPAPTPARYRDSPQRRAAPAAPAPAVVNRQPTRRQPMSSVPEREPLVITGVKPFANYEQQQQQKAGSYGELERSNSVAVSDIGDDADYASVEAWMRRQQRQQQQRDPKPTSPRTKMSLYYQMNGMNYGRAGAF
ncbi:hypothetical protein MGN70_009624 [Eutypa lata]|nr:hypothetical protein MGN70_009624 [Eutypa lata]